jgi:hypothetical protein
MGKSKRSRAAKASHVAIGAAKRALAADMERLVAGAFRSVPTTGNAPFDVLIRRVTVGVEVKTLVDQKNDKITMHPASLARKLRSARALRLRRVYTVVVDLRGRKPVVYYKRGLGSFRLGSLLKLAGFNELKKVVR